MHAKRLTVSIASQPFCQAVLPDLGRQVATRLSIGGVVVLAGAFASGLDPVG